MRAGDVPGFSNENESKPLDLQAYFFGGERRETSRKYQNEIENILYKNFQCLVSVIMILARSF
jgi:hypothetical protein